MKKIWKIILIIGINLMVYSVSGEDIKILISSPKENEVANEMPELKIAFQNTGDNSVKIIDEFTDDTNPFFFDISIKDTKDNSTIITSLPPKISLSSTTRYKDIKAGQTYVVSISLKELIKQNYPNGLPSGTYIIEIAYRNKYGKDCLKGYFKIPPVTFEISNHQKS